MAELRRVGYWRNDRHPELPDPHDFVDPNPPVELLQVVGRYLANGTLAAAYMGFSRCRICDERNGTSEFTDGVYQWPEVEVDFAEERSMSSSDAWWIERMRQLAARHHASRPVCWRHSYQGAHIDRPD